MTFLAHIRATLTAASDFARDGYGHVTNQAAHGAIIGAGGSLALLWLGVTPHVAWLICAAIYWAIWEVAVQRIPQPGDAYQDAVNVGAGGAVICAATVSVPTALAAWAAWTALLIYGWWRRWRAGP